MGYTKSTPINAILADSGELPIQMEMESTTAKYIAKKISLGQRIPNLPQIKQIKNVHNYLEDIAIVTKEQNMPVNLKINKSLIRGCANKRQLNNVILKQSALETINHFKDYESIYTDGSLANGKRGLSIFFKNSGEIYKAKINQKVSIKEVESVAIYLAIKFSVTMKKSKIIIYSDSKSACESLINKSNKFYENKIKNLVSENNIYVIIQWLPGHIGIEGNEIADREAKKALDEGEETNIKITFKESHKIRKDTMWDIWKEKWTAISEIKGKFNYEVRKGLLEPKPWFSEINLSTKEIKTLSRIRTGHCFDKKFLNLMKIEQTNLCENCNEVEDINHLIIKCEKYKTIRDNYISIKKEKEDIKKILNPINHKTYKDICAFVTSIKASI
ncbi:uncharacterized protein LOC129810206 [Phlebotomus papatasi]|uniref:uncharacterized protein LOC129810206 n=1 Tax=Phlebotomus papatasi TaxID=29031 RepID=UPI002483D168|nr:uncharacterized protein LOC129810206 [Phlebotomus papatasi]